LESEASAKSEPIEAPRYIGPPDRIVGTRTTYVQEPSELSKPRVGLVGFFGWGNFGDELFRRVYEQHLGDEFELSVLHDLTQKPYFSRPVEDVVDEVDAIIIGGGDLVIPWQLSGLYWQEAFLAKPVFLVGLGVPKWGGYKREVTHHMRAFAGNESVRFFHARDEPSGAWIEEHLKPNVPVRVAPDIVCALDLPSSTRPEKPILGVATRKRKTDADLTQLRCLCEKAVAADYSIHHLVLGTGDVGAADAADAEALDLPEKTVVRSESLDDLCRSIASCRVLASMKFHGTVVATMYGVPAISLSPTDKSRNFMAMIGREDYLSGLESPKLPDLFSPDIAPISDRTRAGLRRPAEAVMQELKEGLRQVT
jgi:polysaccharide pyruvyl transferase WcaK-like protein